MASSLLAATLSLFDYITDLCKFDNSFLGRMKTALIIYVPPALVCFFFPNGFILAIGYAGLGLTLWSVIVPPFLVKKARVLLNSESYKAPCGNALLNFIIVCRIFVYVTVILDVLGILPIFA